MGVDEFGSVIGIRTGGQAGPTLLLDAHIDTVGIAPRSPLEIDPFGGEIPAGLPGESPEDVLGPIRQLRSLPGIAIKVSKAEGEYHTWTERTTKRNDIAGPQSLFNSDH